jgi:uncharacterized protein (TIGR03086 family)
MSNPLPLYYTVTDRVKEVVAGVQQSQLSDPTPCTEWDVRLLINHFLGGLEFVSSIIAGQPKDIKVLQADSSYLGETEIAALQQAFLDEMDGVVRGVSEPGALERVVTSPFGEMPVSQLLWGNLMDQLIHCWDLARATGQGTTLDAAVVDLAYSWLTSGFADMGRQAGAIGPAIDVPADAAPQDRLLAYMGRQP